MKALAPNTMIQNRYLIVHLIGKGGMGEVYLAVDQRLGSAIALKRTFFADDEMLGNAFEREARTLARLRHPVLPKVSDHFAENGEQYLVMEHIAGDDLAKRLEVAQKPFPLSWVLFWADQLLDALSYLHSHEPPIIHRDIKPQNLKLTDENHIVLLDFGLSKNSTAQTITGGTGATGSTGSVVGYTPHYAPMEQIRGTGTSPKSDVYSLSATLYQLMTNSVPADALSRADSLLNGMEDPIRPLNAINPEISPEISAVVLKGMEVSQDKRWPNAREMQRAMRKAFSSMQEAMSAHTIAFNSDSQVPALSAPPITPLDQETTQASEGPTRLTTGNSAGFVSQDPGVSDSNSGMRQSDVKTEVYRAGDSAISGIGSTDSNSVPITDDFRNVGDREANFEGGATIPNVVYEKAGAPGNHIEAASTPEFFTTPSVEIDSQPYSRAETSSERFDSKSKQPSKDFVTPPVSQPKPVASPASRKKSSRTGLLLGMLAVFFVLGIGAIGAGWFVYANYYAGATSRPSPSPQPSPEFSPSPEPSLQSIANSSENSNVGIESNSNSANENSNLSVSPSPAPSVESPISTPNFPRSNPTPQAPNVKMTPTKPTSTITPKGTPKPQQTPKPKNNRTDIIQ